MFGSSFKSYLFSALYPVLFIATCAFLAVVFSLASPNWEKGKTLLPSFTLANTLIGILLILGEEYAWRGYLLPELSRIKGPVYATVVVGLVWAIWHAPILYGLATKLGTGNPLQVCLVQMGAVLVFSFPFAYSYFLSGSIIPPIIFHWVWNVYNPIVLGNIYRNKSGIMEGNIVAINGEGIMGVALGLFFVAWFLWQAKSSKRSASVEVYSPDPS
jgi:membrane protease YdiL (CAAX protease family)